jgi:hypothetical protein
MEEDIFKTSQKKVEKILERRLKDAVSIAQERLDYEFAHDADLLKALNIVKGFIRDHKRVCYGGTAMNAILPPEKRFYNPEIDLPDYDFFTPDIDGDIKLLVNKLKAEGFTNVFHKIGIHEGTSKILVNFTPVADVTRLASPLYLILHKRAHIVDKIYYTDPDILRMMMYLEISRPRGMVSRWEKVYERLQLFNRNFPPKAKGSTRNATKIVKKYLVIPEAIRHLALNYCLETERVLFTGGPLEEFYRRIINGKRDIFDLAKIRGIIGVLCPDVKEDANAIKQYLGNENIQIYFQEAKGEFVPEYAEIRYNSSPLIILLQETACNSFLSFNTEDGRHINIASLDTLITIWYSISIFTKNLRERIPGIDRTIPKFIQLVEGNRLAKRPNLPPFSLNCQGYQKGFPTLLREKMQRKESIQDKSSL